MAAGPQACIDNAGPARQTEVDSRNERQPLMKTDAAALPALYDSLAERMGDPANFAPLTPISFLSRTADVHPEHESLVYEDRRYTWRETERRCQALARALQSLGIGAHDTVSVLLFNTPEMFECHFGVPLAGAVLNTINVRLESDTVAYIQDFADTRALIVDRELLPVALEGLRKRREAGIDVPIILVDDPHAANAPALADDLVLHRYETLVGDASIARGDYLPAVVANELHPLAINFTSGTTGRPKGVVYHHRGAYLMSVGTIAGWAIPRHARYLYLVPMFHCNGWCHVWTMTAMAATVVCMRAVVPEKVFAAVREEGVTHFGGAPIVLNMLAGAENAPARLAEGRVVHCMTAGAPPPAAVLGRMESMGCEIIHTYGLTETYGHILECEPQPAWSGDDAATLAERKSRQGVRFPTVEGVRVVDRDSGEEVPADAETLGEIEIRGNLVMTGYLKNAEATTEALGDGWFRSGDLAVRHPDGYVQIRDRAKDIIISGGENISSVEIENALYKHPAVGEAAVVAMPDDRWGETPCAFVELSAGKAATEDELVAHCAGMLARFKKPSRIVFGPLPKTATGKIQKFELRGRAKSLR